MTSAAGCIIATLSELPYVVWRESFVRGLEAPFSTMSVMNWTTVRQIIPPPTSTEFNVRLYVA